MKLRHRSIYRPAQNVSSTADGSVVGRAFTDAAFTCEKEGPHAY